jgi:hypothetical protein
VRQDRHCRGGDEGPKDPEHHDRPACRQEAPTTDLHSAVEQDEHEREADNPDDASLGWNAQVRNGPNRDRTTGQIEHGRGNREALCQPTAEDGDQCGGGDPRGEPSERLRVVHRLLPGTRRQGRADGGVRHGSQPASTHQRASTHESRNPRRSGGLAAASASMPYLWAEC